MAEQRVLINHKDIDGLVTRLQHKGLDVFWDGWTLQIFSPNPAAYTKTNGSFRNGTWGFTRRIRVRNDGRWAVPQKYL